MSEQIPPQYRPQQARPRQPGGAHHVDPETRRDVAAALAARTELGPEYEEHVAAGLAERVEQLAAMRTAELRHAAEVSGNQESAERTSLRHRFVLGIVSLGAGIPITAISADQSGLLGLVVAWAGIVGVNVAAGRSHLRR
ncbi:MAG: hypothetical protein AVDCRST_MAG75-617 [uncultured Propionibacteriaceae bacterium]|uniref:Uncharacterized protein n=1 Tax=uncultured Propionibacteriaceae bacterium TaxID=257457 RepID=A0A6J4N460_9ACTN|nr:MAG: hypothetical protein AVDCRST_MAG75-617 [uncultured Propionibacteriaceae bacterium]